MPASRHLLATLGCCAVLCCTALASAGAGCDQKINAVCPDAWKHGDLKSCLACVDANIAKLQPNCTDTAAAEKKCANQYPGGTPTPPPTPGGGGGTGCQKKLVAVCEAAWDRGNRSSCYACAKAHLPELLPDCDLARAEKKCDIHFPPTPAPTPHTPAPPTPAPTPPNPDAPRPHIIVFVVDDQGYANIGYHNPGNVHTPHADGLAAAGVRLERHYTFRWCAPTRSVSCHTPPLASLRSHALTPRPSPVQHRRS